MRKTEIGISRTKTKGYYQIGSKNWRKELHNELIDEGGEAEGEVSRREMKIPDQAIQRRKHFLVRENRQDFWFEPGIVYKADFGNGYIDFESMPFSMNFSNHCIFNE